MRSKNTKIGIEFIIDHVLDAFVCWIWYRTVLFRCLGNLSLTASRWVFLGILISCSAVGILLEFKRLRNSLSIAMNLCAAYGSYTALTYLKIRHTLVVSVTAVSLAAAAVLAGIVLLRRFPEGRNVRRVMLRRVRLTGYLARNVVCGGLGLLMFVLGANAVFGTVLMKPSVRAVADADASVYSIAAQKDVLNRMEEEQWSRLTVREKLDVMQVVANIEARYLGLPHELNVGASNLVEELGGYYSDGNHEIVLNLEKLITMPAGDTLEAVAHEAYHAYQHRMVDAYDAAADDMKRLYLFDRAARYKEEFANYEDGDEDLCAYYTQLCETDARHYAETSVEEYFERLEELGEEDNE